MSNYKLGWSKVIRFQPPLTDFSEFRRNMTLTLSVEKVLDLNYVVLYRITNESTCITRCFTLDEKTQGLIPAYTYSSLVLYLKGSDP